MGTVSLLDDDVCSVMSNSLQPMDCSPPGSSVHADSPGKNWNGWSCPPPEDLPNSGIKPTSLRSPPLAGGFFTTSATWEAQVPGRQLSWLEHGANDAEVTGSIPIQAKLCNVYDQCREETNNYEPIRQSTTTVMAQTNHGSSPQIGREIQVL